MNILEMFLKSLKDHLAAKTLLIIAIVFSTACSSNSTVKEGMSSNGGDEIKTEEESHIETQAEIDVWDIDPVYEYDDIDTSFVSLMHFGNENYQNRTIIYMMDDFYNSSKSLAFTRGYEKGGVFIYKHGRFGVMNGNGEVVIDPQYENFTQWSKMMINESIVMACELKYDYSSDYCTDAWGIGGNYPPLGHMNEDGSITSIFGELIDTQTIYSDAVAAGWLEEGDSFVFHSIGEDDFTSIGDYYLVGKDNIMHLADDHNRTVIVYSDNVILFADFITSEDHSNVAYSNYQFCKEDGSILASGFEEAYGFFEGYAPVKKDGKWGYIDKNGQCITGYIFDKATPLCDGKAWVIYNGRTGKLNFIDIIEHNLPFDEKVLDVEKYDVSDDSTKWIEVQVDNINIRDMPSTSGKKKSTANTGDIFPYLNTTENEGYTWYQLNQDRWIADKDGEWIVEK